MALATISDITQAQHVLLAASLPSRATSTGLVAKHLDVAIGKLANVPLGRREERTRRMRTCSQ